MRWLLCLVGTFCILTGNLPAFGERSVASDTIRKERGGGFTTSVPIYYLPDSLIRDTLRHEYTKIKNIAYKSKFTKELYKMIFVDPRPGRVNVMRTQNSEERFKEFNGKTIKNIYVQVLPPYGSSVYDTTYVEYDLGWLKNAANKVHLRTAERTIRKQLTIKPGMRLSPFELVQNEILLRELPYIDDASMTVGYVKNDSTEVDIYLVCKDEFSWGAEVNSNFINSAKIELENKNFMKLGHVMKYQFSYKGTKDKKWGNIIDYQINSVFGTHFDFRGYYRNDYLEKLVSVGVDRQFLTTMVKWAGGFNYSRVYYSDYLPDLNIKNLQMPFNYHAPDVWLGRSFLLAPKYSYNRNVYLTGRFFKTIFDNRPKVSTDSNHFYYNRNSAFMAFTYTKIKYYKANLIFDFGRTEDVPTGLYLSFVGGFENNEFQNSGYIGVEGRYSHFNKRTERFYSMEAGLGSYVNESGFERGLFKLGASHISNLISFGDYRFRFYNNVNYITGIRRYPEDHLYFQDYDINGFDSDTLRGNQKLSLTLAGTLFLPFIHRGFRASVTGFLDIGAITPRDEHIFRSKSYFGIGAGLNIRNDNVIIKNISIRLAYYPRVPGDVRSIQASMSGNMKSGFYDYRVRKPQVIEYK